MKKTCFIIVLLFISLLLFPEWSDDPAFNNNISELIGDQTIPKTAQNPDGSCYIGWWSNDTGNYNMQLQYLDPAGNIV
jgi:hypothetical protein